MAEGTFESLLERDGKLVYKTRGISMLPMLHENRDLVVIERADKRLKPGDVALYRRGGQYVLHRVLEEVIVLYVKALQHYEYGRKDEQHKVVHQQRSQYEYREVDKRDGNKKGCKL